MTIYFSPTYTSGSYMDLNAMKGGIAMDTSVCDIADLVNLIELHSGKYYPERSVYELRVEYMKALKQMDAANPDNILHESLEIDAISTAKACLAWREKLVLAGWTSDMMPSSRLQALADTEVYFDGVLTLADRVMLLPELIKSSTIAPYIHLVIPYDHHLMHPAVCAIVDALKAKGAQVEVMEDTHVDADCNLKKLADWYDGFGDINAITKHDNTVEILEFENREKAIEWLATLPKSDHEMWISDHCADIDRAMIANDKPACGSMADSGLPPTAQMAMLAVSLFMTPVDINKLVAWLRLPNSPMSGVRYKIASTILSNGGYDPVKTQESLDDYQKNHPDADIDAIKKDLDRWLYINVGQQASKNRFKKFIGDLLDWVEKKAATEYVSEQRSQYSDLVSRLKGLLMLVDMYTGDTIDNDSLEKWMMMCCDACTYPQYTAQDGAHIVISNPGNIIGDAGRVLWCSFSNFIPRQLAYDFLTPSERDALKDAGCRLYDPDVEAKAISIQQHYPLHHCKQLTIIEMAEKGKDEVRSMISQQLRALPGSVCSALVSPTPNISAISAIGRLDANFFGNMPAEFTIGNGSLVKFREQESYSSLDLLVQRPLDYMMRYILNLKPVNDNVVEINKSLGNVAHYVIEGIFRPDRNVDEIKTTWGAEFDKLLGEALMSKGMLLLLPENKIDLVRLVSGLKKAIAALAEIMSVNGLTVIDCENSFVTDGVLAHNTKLDAKLDIRLKRAGGGQAIIDLKWTSGPYSFHDKVKERDAMQLDIYRTVLSMVPEGDKDIICGYFVMPICKLYTCDKFKGKAVEYIDVAHVPAEMMQKISNSYSYRRKQMTEGIIEMGYGLDTKYIQYGADTDNLSLYPLKLISGGKKKERNTYSDYKPFNS